MDLAKADKLLRDIFSLSVEEYFYLKECMEVREQTVQAIAHTFR